MKSTVLFALAAAVLLPLAAPAVLAQSDPEGWEYTMEEHQEGRAVVFMEEWRDMAHLQRHLYAPTFRKLLAVMELAGAVPTVEIDEVCSRRGFDLVEEVLSLHPPGAAAGERDDNSRRHPR